MSGKLGKFEAKGFVNATANTITTNSGFENFFGDNDTETLMMSSIGSKNEREDRGANGLPFLISVADTATRMKTIFT